MNLFSFMSIKSGFFFRYSAMSMVLLLLVKSTCSQDLNYLFRSGDEGYSCFRIPAAVTTVKGSILVFAEARKNSCQDAGDIDLVMKRSEDGGKTWSKMQIVWDDSANTCGNPAPVVDRYTGNIILLSTWNKGTDHEAQIINGKSSDTRHVFVLTSKDDGISWSKAKDISSDTKQPDWTWYATGPCNGIQIRAKKNRGRLIIPCDHIEAGTKKYYSHVIYSDDGGTNWKLGGSTPADQVNECTVAELPGGKLLLNMRNYSSQKVRQTSCSYDGGLSWSALKPDTALREPVCQASMIWYKRQHGRRSFLAFSNPASSTKRMNMTVKLSYNKGKTWKKQLQVYAGPSAYSNLVIIPDGRLACLYEAGVKSPYEGIAFKELVW